MGPTGSFPDGQTLAWVGDGAGPGEAAPLLQTWDLKTGTELCKVPLPALPWLANLAFQPDGKALAIGVHGDGTVRLHDPASGQESRRLTVAAAKEEWVTGLVFAPTGKTLAVRLSDGTVRLWDAETGNELRRLGQPPTAEEALVSRTHGASVTTAPNLAFSPDGKRLAQGQGKRSGSGRLPRARTWPRTTVMKGRYALAVSADGKR